MPKIYAAREIIRRLKRLGFIEKTQKGSHLKMVRSNRVVIIPVHAKDVPLGTFRSILEQAGISYEEFVS